MDRRTDPDFDPDPDPDREPESEPASRSTAASAATTETARLLRDARTYIRTLPPQERRIATLAADGAPAWEIAQAIGIGEAAVARTLDGVIAAVSGRQIAPVETGGLGADTDPGVTGGYGDTGFGALDPDTDPAPDDAAPDDA